MSSPTQSSDRASVSERTYDLLVVGDGERVRTRYLPALAPVASRFAATTATTLAFAGRKLEEQSWDCILFDCERQCAADLRFLEVARKERANAPTIACRLGEDSRPIAALVIGKGVGRFDPGPCSLADLLLGSIESEPDSEFWSFREGENERILIITAADDGRVALARVLENAGHGFEVAADADDGLSRLGGVDVVFTDPEVPGFDSGSWFAALQRAEPNAAIIALLDSATGVVARRVCRLGATGALVASDADAERVRAVLREATRRRWNRRVESMYFASLTTDGGPTSPTNRRGGPHVGSDYADAVRLGLPELNHGVVLLDRDGVIEFVNPQFARTVQAPFTEVLGQPCSTFIAVMDAEAFGGRIANPTESGVLFTECHILGRSGVVLTALFHARAIRTATGEMKTLGVLHDLTAFNRAQSNRIMAQAEELKKTNAELDRFTFIASHDLREPIRGLTIFAESLQRLLGADVPSRAVSLITCITNAAHQAGVLINGMERIASVKTTPIHREPVSVDLCVQEALDRLGSAVEKAGATFSADPLPTVWCDRELLGLVYENLISNAIKFVGERPPEIRLTAEGETGAWILGVKDNGIGIPPEHRETVFKPRSRLHAAGEFDGEGVGLAVSRRALERMGGRIWVDSRPGEGSHFRFCFEYVPADEELSRSGAS